MSAQEATGRTNPRTNFLYVTTDDDGDVIYEAPPQLKILEYCRVAARPLSVPGMDGWPEIVHRASEAIKICRWNTIKRFYDNQYITLADSVT